MICARFLTASREDLFAMTRLLCAALTAVPPRDGGLLVGVNGSMNAGKKIVADTMAETLFDPDTAAMTGKAGYDEYWRGLRGGEAFELDYIDMAYPYRADYSAQIAFTRPCGRGVDNTMEYKFDDFLLQRRAPGLTVVQNAAAFNERTALSVYIEDFFVQNPLGYNVPRLHGTPPSLKRAFMYARGQDSWARLVEIDVRDPVLLNDPAFNEKFIAFAPYCRIERTAAGWRERVRNAMLIDREKDPPGIQGEVRVFGRGDFPRCA
jgi:hypothetical protein